MFEALAGLLMMLIGSQVFVVKALVTRGDEAAKERDRHVAVLIEALTQSLSSFSRFEKMEGKIHARILQAMESHAKIQGEMLALLKEVRDEIRSYRR